MTKIYKSQSHTHKICFSMLVLMVVFLIFSSSFLVVVVGKNVLAPKIEHKSEIHLMDFSYVNLDDFTFWLNRDILEINVRILILTKRTQYTEQLFLFLSVCIRKTLDNKLRWAMWKRYFCFRVKSENSFFLYFRSHSH